jgi:S1-C subfamily serine protease
VRRITLIGFLFVIFAAVATSAASAATKPNKPASRASSEPVRQGGIGASVYRDNVESIVLVEVADSAGRRLGSGVAFRNGVTRGQDGSYVPSSTWVVTNAHVVRDEKTASVSVAGFPTVGDVAYRDQQMDIAFILLPSTVIKPARQREDSTALSAGHTVFAIGAPQGLARSITEGIVSAIRTIDGMRLIQTSAPISEGSSGGGLFVSSGELAGITTFKVVGGESLNFAVDLAQVLRLFDAKIAADILKVGINEKYLSSFGDGFVKWIYSAKGQSGGTVLEEYEDLEARYLKSELTWDQLTEKYLEIVNRYYKLTKSSRDDSASSSRLVLVCQLYGDKGDPPRTLSFTVDFASETINGYSAKIGSESMEFSYTNKTATYTATFDRIAGTVRISTKDFPSLSHGKCSKTEAKAF